MGTRIEMNLSGRSAGLLNAVRVSLSTMTILVALLSASTYSISANAAANACEAGFDPQATSASKVASARISEDLFRSLTLKLRATLSGKLATVWRSEWKAKLQVQRSNEYVMKMIQEFLTPQTQKIVLDGLDPQREEFVRHIHERMYLLQQEGRLAEADELLVRDPPAPAGAIDRTFTYYTKPIESTGSEGKHQIRVRTYLREVLLDQLPVSKEVAGFDMNGRKVAVERIDDGNFKLKITEGKKADGSPIENLSLMTLEQLHQKFGTPIYLFAPHGKNFKLEVKTALTDVISNEKFPLLGGDHMVQKLDMSLSMKEVAQLFSPIDPNLDSGERANISIARVNAVAENSASLSPGDKARVTAVLEVLVEGVRANPDFLKIEGATLYHRTAFESKSGFQTTIDREQSVFASNMYGARGLKSPAGTMTQNVRLHTGVSDARHVELKVPVTVVVPILGMQFHIPPPPLPESNSAQQSQILKAISTYYPYVPTADHSGKFNYMIRNYGSSLENAGIDVN